MLKRNTFVKDSTMKLPRLLLVCPLLALAFTARAEPTVATAHADHLLAATQSWNGKPYTHYATTQPMLSMIRLTLAPNSALPWHVHPFPNAGYVLKGSLTIEDKATGKKQTFHEGQAFAESVEDAHRGVSGSEETVILLTYAGTRGEPTSVPLPGQKAEY